VFIGPDFVSVTCVEAADWGVLGPRAIALLRDFLASGEPLVSVVPERAAEDVDDPELAERVRVVLRERIRPAVARDGGDVALIGVRDGIVKLSLRGACAGCPASQATLRDYISRELRAAVPELVDVVAR
jgi:Fe-S cluster biogenesis protein NfuA